MVAWFRKRSIIGLEAGRTNRGEYGIRAGLEKARQTPRERKAFSLLVCRYTNAEIAEKLHIAPQTAKNYVSSVLRKLGFKGRKEFYRYLEEERGRFTPA